MKKTLIAILALGSVALAGNVTVTNSITFGGDDQQGNRLDFDFNGSTNRTVTINTTSAATIGSTDGFGMGSANILQFNITGTLTVTGTFKGTGNTAEGSAVKVATNLTQDELALISSTGGTTSRDLITGDYLQNLSQTNVTLTLNNLPGAVVYGGLLAKVTDATGSAVTYYSIDNVTRNGGYWGIKNDAQSFDLKEGTAYGYVTMYAKSGAAPKAIGFVATAANAPVPEPTTGSLSLLALAGLCARRRKH